ncbi:hypothetical protein OI450_14700 [Pectobacterium cacticida]|uniref:N-acetylmuramoyl-L-alanine amidase n=1 Tax=Pectobacterium cacticida TaxID=69221 RepID=A0ABZ2GC94_9GAMM|nr:hypothetical protein [Pectobacterium cacticida]UYX06162.1 hypothetical protein OI450_14700 [Pectobacterium cacticida]
MEDGRWKMEDGRWKMEDGRWKMEDGRWKMEKNSANGCNAMTFTLFLMAGYSNPPEGGKFIT